MSRSVSDFLRHILREAEFLVDRTTRLSRADFLADETARRAFVRSLEIIGEATKKLSPEWRAAHPDLDWRAMTGMRDRLIHGYFGVDYEIVWDVASSRMPELRDAIEQLIAEEEEEAQSGGL